MIAYHFTAAQHFAKIQREGIHRGNLPWRIVEGKPTFLRGWQWLTQSPDWNQAWDGPTISNLPYRRTEYRITVAFPSFAMNRVHGWPKLCAHHGPQSAEYLNSFADHRHWLLFHGPIPAQWFIAIDRNPETIYLQKFNEI